MESISLDPLGEDIKVEEDGGGGTVGVKLEHVVPIAIANPPPEANHPPQKKYRKITGPFSICPESGKCKCNICGEEYSEPANWESHYRSAHLQIRCEVCGKAFKEMASHNTHYQSEHLKVKIRCGRNGCNLVFTNQRSLRRHRSRACCGNRRRWSAKGRQEGSPEPVHVEVDDSREETGPISDEEVKRSCFLCLDEINTDLSPLEPVSATATSMRYLSRYLGVDLGQVPLCEGCAPLNERFSELYKELERIQMKVASCLGQVQEKLLRNQGPVGTGHMSGVNVEVTALREKAKNKCSQKLAGIRTLQPRVVLHKLTEREVQEEERRLQPILGTDEGEEVDTSTGKEMVCDICQVPVADLSTHLYTVHFEEVEPKPTPPQSQPAAELLQGPATLVGEQSGRKRYVYYRKEVVPYKCQLCNQTYSRRSSWLRHYRSQHLKVGPKCDECGKQYPDRRGLALHRQSVHLGVRHKCHKCGKKFMRSGSLGRHQRINCPSLKQKIFILNRGQQPINNETNLGSGSRSDGY